MTVSCDSVKTGNIGIAERLRVRSQRLLLINDSGWSCRSPWKGRGRGRGRTWQYFMWLSNEVDLLMSAAFLSRQMCAHSFASSTGLIFRSGLERRVTWNSPELCTVFALVCSIKTLRGNVLTFRFWFMYLCLCLPGKSPSKNSSSFLNGNRFITLCDF